MITLGSVGLTVLLAAGAFELKFVIPVLEKARRVNEAATDAERNPPHILAALLQKDLRGRMSFFVASDLLYAAPSQLEEMQTLSRLSIRIGVGLALRVHFSEQELLTIYLTQTYMGPDVRGFSQASSVYNGVSLKDVTRVQAAKLVVISNGPSYYLKGPKKLERRIEQLLSENPG